MYSYMRPRLLPGVLEEIRRKGAHLSRNTEHISVSTEEINDYLLRCTAKIMKLFFEYMQVKNARYVVVETEG